MEIDPVTYSGRPDGAIRAFTTCSDDIPNVVFLRVNLDLKHTTQFLEEDSVFTTFRMEKRAEADIRRRKEQSGFAPDSPFSHLRIPPKLS